MTLYIHKPLVIEIKTEIECVSKEVLHQSSILTFMYKKIQKTKLPKIRAENISPR
jgi:hypothetical protein